MKRLILSISMILGTTAFAAAPARVLVLPFDSVGPAEKAWIAKAVQQNLLAELGRINSVQAVSGNGGAADADAALKLAAAANAQYVVFGTYQAVDADLRITGQVVDVTTKQAVAGLKATGTQRDLFGMEDIIAGQVKRALPQPVPVAGPEMLQQPPAMIVPQGPVQQVNVNKKLNDLEAQIDKAIERLRFAPPMPAYADDYYYRPVTYRYYPGGYFPYYTYPGYGYGYGYGYGSQYNIAIIGGYRGDNWNANFRIGAGNWSHHGAGTVGVRHYGTAPAGGNYNTFPRLTMQPVRR